MTRISYFRAMLGYNVILYAVLHLFFGPNDFAWTRYVLPIGAIFMFAGWVYLSHLAMTLRETRTAYPALWDSSICRTQRAPCTAKYFGLFASMYSFCLLPTIILLVVLSPDPMSATQSSVPVLLFLLLLNVLLLRSPNPSSAPHEVQI